MSFGSIVHFAFYSYIRMYCCEDNMHCLINVAKFVFFTCADLSSQSPQASKLSPLAAPFVPRIQPTSPLASQAKVEVHNAGIQFRLSAEAPEFVPTNFIPQLSVSS